MRDTDFKGLQALAEAFLNVEISDTEFSPMIIQHPIFTSAFQFIDGEIINILESEENLEKARKVYTGLIGRVDSISDFLMLIRKPYYMAFMKYGHMFMNEKDYGTFLSEAWVTQENPNMDCNVTHEEARELFRGAEPAYLMTDEERAYLDSKPETFTLYRGVAEGRSKEGLSWTDSREKAEWFANRFRENGFVLEKEVSKSDVLAYFAGCGESEFIV